MTVTVPLIETERLVLRAPRIEDLDALCGFFTDQRSRYAGGPLDRSGVWRNLLRRAGHWQLRGYGIWHATLRDSGRLVGYAGVLHHVEWPEPELGWGVLAEHEGQGIAHEAARAARDAAATQFGLTRLVSYIDPGNDRSRALAMRMGAHREGGELLMGTPVDAYRHPEIREEAA